MLQRTSDSTLLPTSLENIELHVDVCKFVLIGDSACVIMCMKRHLKTVPLHGVATQMQFVPDDSLAVSAPATLNGFDQHCKVAGVPAGRGAVHSQQSTMQWC